MSRRIVITVPDDDTDHAEYVHRVADLIHQGYLSGHDDPERHWGYE